MSRYSSDPQLLRARLLQREAEETRRVLERFVSPCLECASAWFVSRSRCARHGGLDAASDTR